MLPELVLDNENFDEIMDEAKNMVISLYPDWTDFNYHDPGITLLELFSWLLEGQQFHIDQISTEHRRKYLKLLGMSMRHRTPATVYAQTMPYQDMLMVKGTRLYAGRICFELVKRKQLTSCEVNKCFTAIDDILQFADRRQLESGLNINLRLFEDRHENEKNSCLYIGFLNPLTEGMEYSMYLKFGESSPIPRNPITMPMKYPIGVLRLEYLCGKGWVRAEHVHDGTEGALITGMINFSLSEPMDETVVFGEKGYFLRLVSESGGYDATPVLEEISMNVMELEQKEQVVEQQDLSGEDFDLSDGSCSVSTALALKGRNTLYFLTEDDHYVRLDSFTKIISYDKGRAEFHIATEERMKKPKGMRIISCMEEHIENIPLASGDGLPFQEYDLEDEDLEYHSFGLMVQEPEHRECYRDWNRVEDFAASGPEDRDYILDTEHGKVMFGDCIHGMAPEGDIIITNYVRTLGRQGNIKSHQIDHFDGMDPEDLPVCNHTGGMGGMDEETLDECFLRARKQMRHSYTAVTNEDYERRVMETPGLILESCKAMEGSKAPELQIVVKPYSIRDDVSLTPVYQNNILSYLEQFSMVGRKIRLLPPRNIMFEVYGSIVLKPHYVEARKTVKKTVEAFFQNIGSQFGACVSANRLYGYLDMLPCVVKIHSLTVDAKSTGVVKQADGTIKLPPDGIARLGDVQFLFSIQ